MSQVCVIAGASGFVGQQLVTALLDSGYDVKCGSRRPDQSALRHPAWNWVHLDVDDTSSLDNVFQGADSLIYLVHQMRETGPDLAGREQSSAHRVRSAAERAGLRRIVYLGGPQPQTKPSPHLAARLATGVALRKGTISTIELQAGMIIGAGSQSWMIVRDLALRLPVMVLPSWLSRRSQPIGIADVCRAIVYSVQLTQQKSSCLALPGPEVVTAREVLERIAAAVGIRPVMIPIPILTPSVSSHWIRWVTRADYAVARKLVEGLTTDLIADGTNFWDLYPEVERTGLDQAIGAALLSEPPESLPPWQRRLEYIIQRISMRAP